MDCECIFVLYWDPLYQSSQFILRVWEDWLFVIRHNHILVHNSREFLNNPLFKLFNAELAREDEVHDVSGVPLLVEVDHDISSVLFVEGFQASSLELVVWRLLVAEMLNHVESMPSIRVATNFVLTIYCLHFAIGRIFAEVRTDEKL